MLDLNPHDSSVPKRFEYIRFCFRSDQTEETFKTQIITNSENGKR